MSFSVEALPQTKQESSGRSLDAIVELGGDIFLYLTPLFYLTFFTSRSYEQLTLCFQTVANAKGRWGSGWCFSLAKTAVWHDASPPAYSNLLPLKIRFMWYYNAVKTKVKQELHIGYFFLQSSPQQTADLLAGFKGAATRQRKAGMEVWEGQRGRRERSDNPPNHHHGWQLSPRPQEISSNCLEYVAALWGGTQNSLASNKTKCISM